MIIDIFKTNLFEKLQQFNEVVETGEHTLVPNFIDYKWMQPKLQTLNPISATYPEISPIQYDKKWCIDVGLSNYTAIFVINELYNNKDILIEDGCSGPGYFIYYLNKLGFNNFSILENFHQFKKEVFDAFIKYIDGNIVLNEVSSNPVVINIAGFPYYPRRIKNNIVYLETDEFSEFCNKTAEERGRMYTNSNLELFCVYDYTATFDKRTQLSEDFKFLCTDADNIATIHCRKDKYEEFKQKLIPYAAT